MSRGERQDRLDHLGIFDERSHIVVEEVVPLPLRVYHMVLEPGVLADLGRSDGSTESVFGDLAETGLFCGLSR